MPGKAGTALSAGALRGSGARRFDAQAEGFDRRVGLPPAAVEAIVEAVLAMAAPAADGVLLEVGTGTGEIGARLVASSGMPYVGLDLSRPMLERFRARLRSMPRAAERSLIAQADADRAWPLRGGRVQIVFISRAVHLLDLGRVVEETSAAAHRLGCVLVLGRVRREAASVRGMLRRQMWKLLAARCIDGRSGELAHRRLLEALARRGGRPRPPRIVARWMVEERPAEVLDAWRSKPGLAGTAVGSEAQTEILDELEAWAMTRMGDLRAARPARESYELSAVDLAALGDPAAEKAAGPTGGPHGEAPP